MESLRKVLAAVGVLVEPAAVWWRSVVAAVVPQVVVR